MIERLNLEMLNPQQYEATTHINGPMLILAGAGSGKTRVITHRVGYLIARGIAPGHILAVSFTNKAANEMVERVAGLIGTKQAGKVHMSTFHSLGHQILSQDIDALGYKKPFTILDDGDQRQLIREIFRETNLDPKVVDPKSVLFLISRAKMAFTEPAHLKEFRYNPDLPFAQRVYEYYKSALKGRNAVDFDDLICLPVQLFQEHEDLRRKYAERYQYVMIDEYQDTNHTQLMFLNEIVRDHKNLCVVGDDDQSIYGFRGAVAENILEFEHEYPSARVIKLEQNYRSTNTILEAANAVIAHNTQRKAKRLWSAKTGGEKLRWVACQTEREEAEFVAAEIERLSLDRGWSYRDFAILYRSNAQARLFEEGLRTLGLPYEVIGGQEFYDRKEVKDFVAYLKVCFNPGDENSLRRIVNTPSRGIGPVLLERISDFALLNQLEFFEALQMIARRPELIEGIGLKVSTRLGELTEILEDFHARFERDDGTPMAEIARALLKRLDFEDYLRSQETNRKIARRRIENLENLLSDISSFGSRHEGGSLQNYLTRLTLNRRAPGAEGDEIREEVRLMTLHSSKGLEFPCVFMVGVEEGYLPHENSMDSVQELSEERRLTYVGITRAKEALYLTTVTERSRYGKPISREPSRFLEEIPQELIEQLRGADTSSLERQRENRNQKYLDLARKMFDF